VGGGGWSWQWGRFVVVFFSWVLCVYFVMQWYVFWWVLWAGWWFCLRFGGGGVWVVGGKGGMAFFSRCCFWGLF